jgi:hypothetical protein
MAASTEKVSVSLANEDLAWARQKAEAGATSLSAVLSAAIRRQRQSEARRRLLEELGTDDITAEDLEAARAERR